MSAGQKHICETPDGRARRGRRPGRFRRNEDGVTAVEFALVAAPFFALVFAILETALIFFAGQVMETAVADAARLIRTGQAQTQKFDAAAFKKEVCARILGLFNCENGLMLDVRTYQSFNDVNFAKPVDDKGNLVPNFVYQPGVGGDIVVVRAFYEWPTIVPTLGVDMADLANGKRLLSAAVTFRYEPF
jgi:Flp pilus assembly protein TadG